MYLIRRMTGRCANGAERDGGKRWHAVETDHPYGSSVCGNRPGRLGNGWAADRGEGVTCPGCLYRLRKRMDNERL